MQTDGKLYVHQSENGKTCESYHLIVDGKTIEFDKTEDVAKFLFCNNVDNWPTVYEIIK